MNEPEYLASLDHPVHDLLWVHARGYAIPGDGDRRLKHYGKKEDNMNISDEAVEAAAEAAARSEDIAWDVTYLRDAYRKLARAALEGAVPIITEQTRQEVIALARWLMHAELTESLEVLDILAGGDTSKALARVLDAPWG